MRSAAASFDRSAHAGSSSGKTALATDGDGVASGMAVGVCGPAGLALVASAAATSVPTTAGSLASGGAGLPQSAKQSSAHAAMVSATLMERVVMEKRAAKT
jgi:hypothetical protein